MIARSRRNIGELDAFIRGWASALLVVAGFALYFAIPPIEVARVVALTCFALSVPFAITAKLRFDPLYWLARRSTHKAVSREWDPRSAMKRGQRGGRA